MERKQIRMCLVSSPGPVRDATMATLAGQASVKLAAIASGALTATRILQHARCDLILLDANLPEDEVVALLQWKAEHRPEVRCLVATITSGQLHQALACGAEHAIRRDELPAKLAQVVDDLLEPNQIRPDASPTYDKTGTSSV